LFKHAIEKIIEQGYEFMIKDMDGHHILYLEVLKYVAEETDDIIEASV